MAAISNSATQGTVLSARPAEPLLASSLLASSSLPPVAYASLDVQTSSQDILRTGISSLDDALGTVFHSSRLVALSSETNNTRIALTKALLVDCLVKHAQSAVAVIDSTGHFDVVSLYRLIVKRLEKEAGDVAGEEGGSGASGRGIEAVAAEVLDRVKIMRVFDFVGMKEAVGELRDEFEGRVVGEEEEVDAVLHKTQTEREVEGAVETAPPPKPRRTEIADSEDEDEGLEDSDDEMLFDTPAPAIEQVPSPQAQQTTPKSPLKLILIDNLAHVLHPLLKQDAPSANTLATTFLTTLRDLTRTHALHTILLNPCTTPRTSSPTRKSDTAAPTLVGPHLYTPQPPPPPSIFSSNAAVPAMLGLMSRYADAHVLGSLLPWRKMDANVYYGDAGGRERGKRRGVQMVSVLEVIADRWGGTVGAWGAFKEGKDGDIEGL